MNRKVRVIIMEIFYGEDAQSIIEYVLIGTLLIFIGFFGFRLFCKSLGGYFKQVAKFRTGITGMLP